MLVLMLAFSWKHFLTVLLANIVSSLNKQECCLILQTTCWAAEIWMGILIWQHIKCHKWYIKQTRMSHTSTFQKKNLWSHELLFLETNQSVFTPSALFPPVSQDVWILKGFPLAFSDQINCFYRSRLTIVHCFLDRFSCQLNRRENLERQTRLYVKDFLVEKMSPVHHPQNAAFTHKISKRNRWVSKMKNCNQCQKPWESAL